MDKIRVSAVSYLNSIPFVYGLEKSSVQSQIELSLDIPSECANKLLDNQVDLALVPVAIIPQLKFSEIISPYCIGANGPVETVCLFSQVSLNEIEEINNGQPLTYFEALTAAFFHGCKKYKQNLVIAAVSYTHLTLPTTPYV